MKFTFAIIIIIFPLLVSTACNSEGVVPLNDEGAQEIPNKNAEIMKDTITITVGNKVFKATLEANATVSAFKAMLPLTIDMRGLNNNEKFFDFSSNLPANASNPRTINSGDIMLWGSNTIVLFYKTFSTTYSYTRVGKIENPSGLAAALGLRYGARLQRVPLALIRQSVIMVPITTGIYSAYSISKNPFLLQ